ncbi:putative Transmembrane protein [Mycena venus]|uniref:Putative Transmembrane protein n=1 Tax=Mycena venus TaxID=2733690 RepID=A0A8H6XQE6_9AGAR|nr:putative Transmembrane protein [Mycena venus]
MFSLMSALGASLAKGWISQFSSPVSGSTWVDASLHCQRLRGLLRWRLKLIIEFLPILIHIAFFLFSAGLVILLFQDDLAIGVVICTLTGLILILYFGSSMHPAFSADSPFRTPISGMIRHLVNGSWRFQEFSPFPSAKDTQKAQALTWLMTESPNEDTIEAAIHAIAGLPANPAVQDELFRDTFVSLLVTVLADRLAKHSKKKDSLISCLYALLHLVQVAPANPKETVGTGLIRDLINTGGALSDTDSIPFAARGITLCVKARIILLLCDGISDPTLFATEIPVLTHACADTHTRRLLIQIWILSRPPSKSLGGRTSNYLSVLRNPFAANRNQIHSELVEAAISERFPVDVVPSGAEPATLLEGLTTGSTELRKQCAELFVKVANDSAFRQQLAKTVSPTELCSLVKCEDNDTRKCIVTALTNLAADDRTQRMIIEALPAIIERLDQTPSIAPDVARFLVHTVRYDGLCGMMAASATVPVLIALAKRLDGHKAQILIEAIADLANHDQIRYVLTTSSATLSSLLELVSPKSQMAGKQCGIVDLVQRHADVRDSISSFEMMPRIISMLDHANSVVREGTLEILVALVQHSELQSLILSSVATGKIASMLKDGSLSVRRATLETITFLAVHGSFKPYQSESKLQSVNFRASICVPETLKTILSIMLDKDEPMGRFPRIDLLPGDDFHYFSGTWS